MSTSYPKFKAAAVQAAPVYLNRDATVRKACDLIKEAGENGAKLVAFPEVFIAGYPYWVWTDIPQKGGQWFRRLFKESVEIPSSSTDLLCKAARQADAYVVIGLNERTSESMGTMWNTNLVIGRNGDILGKCRKLVPTRAEKMVWALGDGTSLKVFDTDVGKLGVLSCGSNANPLARFALLAQGEQIHVANYPAFPNFPNFKREIEIRSAAHSHEGKVFTLVSTGTMSTEIIDMLCDTVEKKDMLSKKPSAYSAIFGPKAEVLVDIDEEEGIIYTDIDIEDEIEPKQSIDITGQSARFDVLSLNLSLKKEMALSITDEQQPFSESSKATQNGSSDANL